MLFWHGYGVQEAELKVLITGGAGFIGTHLYRRLLGLGHDLRVLDNLTPQVHGEKADPGKTVSPDVEFMYGDVRDRKALGRALEGVECVFHLAAQTGVGQSMYQIKDYSDCNIGGTAMLLDLLANGRRNVQRVVVASSRAVYGEGKYSCPECGIVYPPPRSAEQMEKKDWEVRCPKCSLTAKPLPTDEDKPLRPGSVYAISKRDQEEMAICVGQSYGIPTTALRFFNIYGSGQSLTNPYTGIITIFASRIKQGNPPLIYEDGLETRDFVHVSDVVSACILAMESENADYQVVNVGSGTALSVLDMARIMIQELDADMEPEVISKYRVGDIRHCHADLTMASRVLGYEPAISFEEGIREFLLWARNSESVDMLATATAELEQRGLFR